MRVGGHDGSGIEAQLHTEADDGELKREQELAAVRVIPRQERPSFTQTGSPNLLFSTIPTKGSKTKAWYFCSVRVPPLELFR